MVGESVFLIEDGGSDKPGVEFLVHDKLFKGGFFRAISFGFVSWGIILLLWTKLFW